ncbi:MAG: DUF933 domain-containing protein [Candidatus Omnitrophica bacterium]|nr:DUF933 domain-containing protein [Candidatus Omnitrophota bacterium]
MPSQQAKRRVKIGIFSIPEIPLGKHNIKDSRLDQLDKINKAKKKTYIQIELVSEDNIPDAQALITSKDARTDLILKDLEFIETRLARAEEEFEKALLNKLKSALEKEDFITSVTLNEEEKKIVSGYGLFTNKSIAIIEGDDLGELDSLLVKSLGDSGLISFFTANERETRAWLIRGGATAWDAAGAIHSDIQKGFIRAEVISFNDLIQAGSATQAKQAGKMRLEQKEYLVCDGDLINFRFNK